MDGDNSLCFLLADGEHARFVAVGRDNALHTVRSFDSIAAHLASRDIGSDRPGRADESMRPGSHGVTPRHDLHEQEKLRFADFVADEAGIAAGEGLFHRLVLVAPSYFLREVEESLDARTAAMLAGFLAKDLVKVPDHELRPHLREWVAAPWRATLGG